MLAIVLGTAVAGIESGRGRADPSVGVAPSTVNGGQTPASSAGVRCASRRSAGFRGTSFGTVGRYEQVRGTIVGLVDPADARARRSQTWRAPRNKAGLVQYESSSCSSPVDPSKGNHKVVCEPTNAATSCRCSSSTTPPTNDPSRTIDAGNGF